FFDRPHSNCTTTSSGAETGKPIGSGPGAHRYSSAGTLAAGAGSPGLTTFIGRAAPDAGAGNVAGSPPPTIRVSGFPGSLSTITKPAACIPIFTVACASATGF